MSAVIITGSTTIRELDVSENAIGGNGISDSVITEGLQSNKTLTKLCVSACHIREEGSY